MSIYIGITEESVAEEPYTVTETYANFFFWPIIGDIPAQFPKKIAVTVDGLTLQTGEAYVGNQTITISQFGPFRASCDAESQKLMLLKEKLPAAAKAFCEAMTGGQEPECIDLFTNQPLPAKQTRMSCRYSFTDAKIRTETKKVTIPRQIYFSCDAPIPEQAICGASLDGKLTFKARFGWGVGWSSDNKFYVLGQYGLLPPNTLSQYTDKQIQEALLALGENLLQAKLDRPAWVKTFQPVQSTVTKFVAQ